MKNNKSTLNKYPFEYKADILLTKISDDRQWNVRTVFDDFPVMITIQECKAIIHRLKEDGYILFVNVPVDGTNVEFPFFKITGKGVEFRLRKGYVKQAMQENRLLKHANESVLSNRLDIFSKTLLIISLLINVLYVFGVITWNLQDSTKNKTEQQVQNDYRNRQNTKNQPVKYNSVNIDSGIINNQGHICHNQ